MCCLNVSVYYLVVDAGHVSFYVFFGAVFCCVSVDGVIVVIVIYCLFFVSGSRWLLGEFVKRMFFEKRSLFVL